MSRIRSTNSAFTLVEVLIVVAILGILSAVVIPEYRNYAQKAKESAAKESLQIFRSAIERYAIEHDGIPPGYPLNDRTSNPTAFAFFKQLLDEDYISDMPENPFNHKTTVTVLKDADPFPDSANGSTGWIYKPATKDIRLNWTGADSKGKSYYEY